jgi:hypothetical protein
VVVAREGHGSWNHPRQAGCRGRRCVHSRILSKASPGAVDATPGQLGTRVSRTRGANTAALAVALPIVAIQLEQGRIRTLRRIVVIPHGGSLLRPGTGLRPAALASGFALLHTCPPAGHDPTWHRPPAAMLAGYGTVSRSGRRGELLVVIEQQATGPRPSPGGTRAPRSSRRCWRLFSPIRIRSSSAC